MLLEAQRGKLRQDLDRVIQEYASAEISGEDYEKLSTELKSRLALLDGNIERNLQILSRQAMAPRTAAEAPIPSLELSSLKAQLKEKSEEIMRLRDQLKKYEDYVEKHATRADLSVSAFEEKKRKVYEVILGRYKDELAEKETKTAGEIRAMVNPNDLTVKSLVERFKQGLPSYVFSRDYEMTAKRAFDFVKDNVSVIESDLGIPFWLTPTEVVRCGAGDDEDRAVLLCSVLQALEDENARVVIAELSSGATHAFVLTKIKGSFLVLDPLPGSVFGEAKFFSESDVLRNYRPPGLSSLANFLYSFNNSFYKEYGS